jgi:hypothetical protein
VLSTGASSGVLLQYAVNSTSPLRQAFPHVQSAPAIAPCAADPPSRRRIGGALLGLRAIAFDCKVQSSGGSQLSWLPPIATHSPGWTRYNSCFAWVRIRWIFCRLYSLSLDGVNASQGVAFTDYVFGGVIGIEISLADIATQFQLVSLYPGSVLYLVSPDRSIVCLAGDSATVGQSLSLMPSLDDLDQSAPLQLRQGGLGATFDKLVRPDTPGYYGWFTCNSALSQMAFCCRCTEPSVDRLGHSGKLPFACHTKLVFQAAISNVKYDSSINDLTTKTGAAGSVALLLGFLLAWFSHRLAVGAQAVKAPSSVDIRVSAIASAIFRMFILCRSSPPPKS